jgi:hypothetical protein
MDSKKTLCGYAWNDIYTALFRSIGNGEMNRSQRWAAELLCSETGVSRLEAVLLAVWAEHVGSAMAYWPGIWHATVLMLRSEWIKAGGDNRTFRNNPNIRNRIAECVGYLVVSSKKPRPAIPKSADVFKEAEAVRTRLHSGGASVDQVSTRRVWDQTEDAPTMRTIGNELEAAIRTAQTTRALFWLVWILTLDSQKTRPTIKDRSPQYIQGKAKKCLAWYVVAILKDMATHGLDVNNCISQTLDFMTVVWMRLGAKYRKDVLATVVVMLCERIKSTPMECRQPHECVDIKPIKIALLDIDSIYEEVSRDMKIVPTATAVGTVPGLQGKKTGNVIVDQKKEDKLKKQESANESSKKMEETAKLMRKMYGMDDED